MLKKIFILIILFLTFGCREPKTHGKFISKYQDVWIDGYAISLSEHKVADKGLVFCRANVDKDGNAKPICFSAKYVEAGK